MSQDSKRDRLPCSSSAVIKILNKGESNVVNVPMILDVEGPDG
jgi:hypothetical protein